MSRGQPDYKSGLRWSASALLTLERCGERFRRRYVERESGPGSLPAVVGSAVHAAARLDNVARRDLDKRPQLSELVDVAVAAFDERLEAEHVDAKPHERGAGRNGAAGGARGWGVNVSPTLPRPLAAEERVEAQLGDFTVTGILDYVTPGPAGECVGDLKTGRKPAADAAARSSQLSVYGVLWRARSGRWPGLVALDHLAPPGKRSGDTWAHERYAATRGPGDYAALLARLERARLVVEAGAYLPAPEHEPTCSAKWCEFWKDCPLIPPARRGLAGGEEDA